MKRIYLYWALLLIPTLLVGAGALYLLKREEVRLKSQAGQVEESRRAALQARAQLAAESVDLIVNDVQSGLRDVLSSAPETGLEASLDKLEVGNPLVRLAFISTSESRLRRPNAGTRDPIRASFIKRFESSHGHAWMTKSEAEQEDSVRKAIAPAIDEAVRQLEKTQAPAQARGPSSSYAENVMKARRDVQALNAPISQSKTRSAVYGSAPALAAPSAPRAKQERKGVLALVDKEGFQLLDEESLPPSGRAGWYAQTSDGELSLVVWNQGRPGGLVWGVDIEMAALISRIGAALPSDLPAGEGLCLRDGTGRILQQSGTLNPTGAWVGRAIVNARLPGWVIEAHLEPSRYSSGGGSAFFLVSSLVVGAFVIAILSGGSLLLIQARRSALEAVQKTSFVSSVSHELKTPLTSIRLYTELLEQKRVASEEKRDEYLRIITRETERLTRLVNNVLDFSRLEQGRKPIHCTAIDLQEELQRVVNMLEAHASEAGLKLECELPSAPVLALADRDAFGQILINLADNAVKYAAEGGELRLCLQQASPERVELRVLDRGPGVPKDLRERIFEKFHRIDQSLTAEKSGAGLGLSIARQLARAMGGELSCQGREGGGAEFLLVLNSAHHS